LKKEKNIQQVKIFFHIFFVHKLGRQAI